MYLTRMRYSSLAALLVTTCLSLNALADEPMSLQISETLKVSLTAEEHPCFVLEGIASTSAKDSSADAAEWFSVTVDSAELNSPPSLLGEYHVADSTITFVPRFKLSDKVKYRFQPGPRLSALVDLQQPFILNLPPPSMTPVTRVDAIYPSASALPENLLKFYIHFSSPMSRGQAYEQIELLQGDQVIQEPFLELGEELWDGQQTRFTLFIHPGRIKRGLKPREDDGPALEAGHKYTLRIKADWPDAQGRKLIAPSEKKFTTLPADLEQPSLELWKIHTPAMNSRDPVTLELNEPMDHAMLERVLTVRNQDEEVVTGSIEVTNSEMQWSFTPAKVWAVGTHRIDVAANLEDLCGNSIARPFEVKMQDNTAAAPSTKVAIEFIVK